MTHRVTLSPTEDTRWHWPSYRQVNEYGKLERILKWTSLQRHTYIWAEESPQQLNNNLRQLDQSYQPNPPRQVAWTWYETKVLKVSVGTTDVKIYSWLQERTSPECYPIVSCETLFMTRSLNPSLDSDPTVGHQTWSLQRGRYRRNAGSKTKNCTRLFFNITWHSLSSFYVFSNLW